MDRNWVKRPGFLSIIFVILMVADVAVMDDKDLVGVFDHRKPVGDDEARAVLHEMVHRLHNEFSIRVSTELVALSRMSIFGCYHT